MVPKTTPNKNEKEERILYQKLNYELQDLAKLRIPLNLLYKRYEYKIPTLL